jgi:hypothetical protein
MPMLLKRIVSVMIVAAGLLASVDAFAGDYTVSYAFDGTTREDVAAGATSSRNEAGTTKECQYEKPCTIDLMRSDLTISIDVRRSNRHEVVVYAYGGRSHSAGCCLFSGGEQRAEGDLAQPLLWLRIYEGHARKRNEFVENIHLGLLHLQFSDLK